MEVNAARTPARIYFVAGEASGDSHGAALLAALKMLQPDVALLGRGGPKMKAVATGSFNDWSEGSAVLGLWEVLRSYRYFRREFGATLDELKEHQPDALVLIDYPGFNLRLAKAARRGFPKLRIIYYISPQVWAWNRSRIRSMAQHLDLMLCIFPFEASLYNESGLRTVFVGHPMAESIARRQTTATDRDPQLVGLFPGSRQREIRKILPVMLQAAERVGEAMPRVRFQIAAASPRLVPRIEEALAAASIPRDRVTVSEGHAPALMQTAQAGMVASGTATLQAALYGMPFVLVYRVAWLTYLAARLVVKVKYLGMANILAGREVVPEFIQHRAKARPIAEAVLRLVKAPDAREQMRTEFASIGAALLTEGASMIAAREILAELRRK